MGIQIVRHRSAAEHGHAWAVVEGDRERVRVQAATHALRGLLTLLDETQPGPPLSDQELAWQWMERNDAQNYVVLGDPAVQVRATLLQ